VHPFKSMDSRRCRGEPWVDGSMGNARDIGEPSDLSDGERQSAGALEAELLDAGLESGGLEAEQRGGAGRAADAPAGLGARPPILRSFSEGSCVFSKSIPWIFTAGSIQLLDSAGSRPHRAPHARDGSVIAFIYGNRGDVERSRLTVYPRATGRREQAMDINFWLGILIGLVAGGGVIWYLKVRSLETAVVTMTGEYRNAEKGRKELEAKIRQHPMPAAS